MPRRVAPEFLDDPALPAAELAASLSYLRKLNRRLGGINALLRHLRRWSARWPQDRPVTLLDVGTGSADLPLAAVEWAREAGFDLRVTAIDNHAGTLEVARRLVGADGVTLTQMNALDIGEAFAPGAFDYVHAGLVLHHLDDDSVVRVLRAMDRVARAGVVWNDLMRSVRGVAATWIFTLPARRCIRHDAIASVRAGFTQPEAELLARRAGLDYCGYSANFNVQRFTIAGEKSGTSPGAAEPAAAVEA